jgi:hypothetical protein
MNKSTLKSIGAIGAGVLTVFVLSIGTDVVLHASGAFPGWGQPMSDALFALATLYRTLFAVAGGYVTARLALDKPMKHALIYGVVGVVLTIAGTIATWNQGPEFGPHWYPLALIATSMPCAWLGGKLKARQ